MAKSSTPNDPNHVNYYFPSALIPSEVQLLATLRWAATSPWSSSLSEPYLTIKCICESRIVIARQVSALTCSPFALCRNRTGKHNPTTRRKSDLTNSFTREICSWFSRYHTCGQFNKLWSRRRSDPMQDNFATCWSSFDTRLTHLKLAYRGEEMETEFTFGRRGLKHCHRHEALSLKSEITTLQHIHCCQNQKFGHNSPLVFSHDQGQRETARKPSHVQQCSEMFPIIQQTLPTAVAK